MAVMKLLPTMKQREALLSTMERFNTACDWLASEAFVAKCTSKFELQKAHYQPLREKFGLSAQMAIRAIAKVCEVYKRDKSIRPNFRSRGAVPYDARVLSRLRRAPNNVSILTLEGRESIAFVAGGPHKERLDLAWGQTDLVLRKGRWYLFVTVDEAVESLTPPAIVPTEWLGVDFGIVNLATDSDGTIHTGAGVEAVRVRSQQRRRILQQVGTRSAKRALKRLSGKEARFRANTNHCLSKTLVARAKDTQRGVALEDLEGIREGIRFSKAQRTRVGGWAFYQLRSFVQYKAMRACVVVMLVDPRNTSRTCPQCGFCDALNRPSQAQFCCKSCGFEQHADVVAARNIAHLASRAAVNRPMVSPADVGNTETTNRVPRLSAETSSRL